MKKDLDIAAVLYKLSAEQGNSEGQYALGRCYENGIGFVKDLKKAFKFFKLAAEQGHVEARRALIEFYDNGVGTKKDYKLSFKLQKELYDTGDDIDTDTLCYIAHSYLDGDGVDKDLKEAFKYFSLAAEQGDDDAQHQVGLCYANGNGVEQNTTEAIKWFNLAITQGHIEAKCDLVEHLVNQTKDYKEKLRLAIEYTALNSSYAQCVLGQCYMFGYWGIKVDFKEALRLFTLSANQKNYMGQYYLGWIYHSVRYDDDYNVIVKRNPKQAYSNWNLAAAQGHETSKTLVALCRFYNKGTVCKNKEAQTKVIEEMATLGCPLAMFEMMSTIDDDSPEKLKWSQRLNDLKDDSSFIGYVAYNIEHCYDWTQQYPTIYNFWSYKKWSY